MTTFPKPGRRKRQWLTVMRDQREVLDLETRKGQQEYRLRTTKMWQRQNGICPLCGHRIPWEQASFDHEVPRGMGGAMRDDRIEIIANGQVVYQNQCVHLKCNILRGSRRMPVEKLTQQPIFAVDKSPVVVDCTDIEVE